jgi:uncharacterized protein (TIGR01777 family)
MNVNGETFQATVELPVPAAAAFAWHERPGAFERLAPPWMRVRVLRRSGDGVRDGARVTLQARDGWLVTTWEVEHRGYAAGREFRDVQRRGPFAAWEHIHRVEPADPGDTRSRLTDTLHYRLPGGVLGRWFGGRFARRELSRLFRLRHARTAADLAAWARWAHRPRMRIAVTGATGLVGSALVPFLTTQGHNVVKWVRRAAAGPDEVAWDPAGGRLELAALRDVDAVVHLAGENLASGRWTAERKRAIRDSRIASTRLVAERLAEATKADGRPRVWASASAIGFYGNRGEEALTEDSAGGDGFLAAVCRDWEAATEAACAAGVRVAHLRFGVVLSPQGGALAKLLPPFRAGLGGPVGDGRMWMSWIGLDDAVGAVGHVLHDARLAGPVNIVAPHPVRGAEFAATLGQVLHRPAVARVPAMMLKLMFGEMAEATILASAKVHPARLEAAGYSFRHAHLAAALSHLLGKEPTE